MANGLQFYVPRSPPDEVLKRLPSCLVQPAIRLLQPAPSPVCHLFNVAQFPGAHHEMPATLLALLPYGMDCWLFPRQCLRFCSQDWWNANAHQWGKKLLFNSHCHSSVLKMLTMGVDGFSSAAINLAIVLFVAIKENRSPLPNTTV